MDTSPDKTKAPNWAAIERDFRAGVKSVRQIATENGITHGAINKRAKRDEWTRDLKAKIQAKADAIVSKAVSGEVAAAKRQSESAVVDSNAHLQANVRLRHRTDALRLSRTLERLSEKLDSAEGQKLSLTEQSNILARLVSTHASLVATEREAYGIKVEPARDENLATLATAELLRLRKELAGA